MTYEAAPLNNTIQVGVNKPLIHPEPGRYTPEALADALNVASAGRVVWNWDSKRQAMLYEVAPGRRTLILSSGHGKHHDHYQARS